MNGACETQHLSKPCFSSRCLFFVCLFTLLGCFPSHTLCRFTQILVSGSESLATSHQTWIRGCWCGRDASRQQIRYQSLCRKHPLPVYSRPPRTLGGYSARTDQANIMSGAPAGSWFSKTAVVQTRRLFVAGGNCRHQRGGQIWSAVVIKRRDCHAHKLQILHLPYLQQRTNQGKSLQEVIHNMECLVMLTFELVFIWQVWNDCCCQKPNEVESLLHHDGGFNRGRHGYGLPRQTGEWR